MSEPRLRRAAWLVAVLLLALAPAAVAKRGAYRATKHGDPLTGVQRLPEQPRGECTQCHGGHGRQGERLALFVPNDNQLCATCHSAPTAGPASYQGVVLYGQAAHATSSMVAWPGPEPRARGSGDAGKCVNCHNPHGVRDATGVIPSMLVAREEAACLPCHDGSPAQDRVAVDLVKQFRHPTTTVAARHSAAEGDDPARYAATPVDARHAECADCHNPHVLQLEPLPRQAPEAPAALAGVGRVRVTNGAAGVPPLYTWVTADDLAFAREYEVCFKCHSSWTRQPAGQPDLAMLLNPANASFHPVEAAGKNRLIREEAFVTPWTWDRLVYCGDCHGSDDESTRGPHGSSYRGLLRRNYPITPLPAASSQADLCFKCHAFSAYADPGAAATAQAASRFAGANGHTYHVGTKSVPCYACHDSHGSALYPALLAVGRVPGLTGYVQDAAGATCLSTCHASKRYDLGYPR